MTNRTTVKEFILLGYTVSSTVEAALFCAVFVVYTLSIIINVTIINLIWTEQLLHKPMYFFISVFSFLEVWYPTVTVPGLLRALLLRMKAITFGSCMAQFYFHFALGATENFLLIVMAFDRCVAICKPLHYMIVMKHRNCVMLAVGSWIGGFSCIILLCTKLSQMTFCGPNKVDHYYCDFAPLVKLACSETTQLEALFFMTSSFVILISFLLIIVSYACILGAILKLSTNTGRKKAFYTCASHMIVVLIFYGTTIFMFVKPTSGNKVSINKMVSLFPSVLTPLLNPIIYSLRNQEVKKALQKAVHCTYLYL
ncbi:olfactory receptor 6F1-like [Phyllobates terribilis]|uniref:olfactory receptor 6F1-like n=1 Tax=Phyllobates terribilis TaxID=111132 RepID=UPI003CCB603D